MPTKKTILRENGDFDVNSEAEIDLLVERVKGGDSDAFSVIVEKYERFVYNTACSVLRGAGLSQETAEDIAQDSFIKAWRSIGSFRGDCSFSTWLFRITVNTAKDRIRQQMRHTTVSLSRTESSDSDSVEWDLPIMSSDPVPEDIVEQSELILGVRRAIEELPEDQKRVVILRDIHELSYQEISRILGMELGTVKSRLNRGRANLKTILEKGNFI